MNGMRSGSEMYPLPEYEPPVEDDKSERDQEEQDAAAAFVVLDEEGEF